MSKSHLRKIWGTVNFNLLKEKVSKDIEELQITDLELKDRGPALANYALNSVPDDSPASYASSFIKTMNALVVQAKDGTIRESQVKKLIRHAKTILMTSGIEKSSPKIGARHLRDLFFLKSQIERRRGCHSTSAIDQLLAKSIAPFEGSSSVQHQMTLGIRLLRSGHIAAATKELEEAVSTAASGETRQRGVEALARCYWFAGEEEKRQRLIERAMKESENDDVEMFHLSWLLQLTNVNSEIKAKDLIQWSREYKDQLSRKRKLEVFIVACAYSLSDMWIKKIPINQYSFTKKDLKSDATETFVSAVRSLYSSKLESQRLGLELESFSEYVSLAKQFIRIEQELFFLAAAANLYQSKEVEGAALYCRTEFEFLSLKISAGRSKNLLEVYGHD